MVLAIYYQIEFSSSIAAFFKVIHIKENGYKFKFRISKYITIHIL